MPKIRKVLIQNFRSIRKLEFDVMDLTVMVGDNDCGKSNILRALNLFFTGKTNPGIPLDFSVDFNRFVQPGKNKAKEIIVELTLELPSSYQKTNGEFVRWRKVWRESGLREPRNYIGLKRIKSPRTKTTFEEIQIPPKSNAHALLSRIEFEYVPAIRSTQFFRQLRGRIYSVIAAVAERGFREKSADFESAISDNVKPLVSDVLEELNDNTRLRLPNDLSAIFESLDFLSGSKSISLDNRGDGIKGRYIPLILKFIAEKKRSLLVRGGQPYTFIWAYEEPENNLEFRRAQELAETFRQLAVDELTQIILTTHSPVFFNMHDSYPEMCCARYVHHEGEQKGTETDASLDAVSSLDERMGVMPIIAPHIQRAEKEVAAIRRDLADARSLLTIQNLPPIFFEGRSDHIVFQDLLNCLRPELANQIYLQEPPQNGAGADYVANSLIAWGLIQKGRPVEERVRAFGILDSDNAGKSACERVDEQGIEKHVRYKKLIRPEFLYEPARKGIPVPVCLEENYPVDWWLNAQSRGWLVPRKKEHALSDVARRRILNGESTWAQLTEGHEWSVIVENQISSDHKLDWAKSVARKTDEEKTNNLPKLLAVLDASITFLL